MAEVAIANARATTLSNLATGLMIIRSLQIIDEKGTSFLTTA